jgi:hypothetical protein
MIIFLMAVNCHQKRSLILKTVSGLQTREFVVRLQTPNFYGALLEHL